MRRTAKRPVPVLPADMREAQEVEGLRLAFPSSFPVLLGIPPELGPARLVRVQFQSELSQPFFQAFAKTVCVGSPLEAEDDIVRIADDDHLTSRILLAPDIHPEIEHIVEIDVGKERRDLAAYTKGNFEFERVVRGWRTSYPVLDLRLKR
jgi:hypothetical protein